MSSPKKTFSQIYDSCVDKIYRFIYLKVSSQEVAQDLCSETFLKGWQIFKENSQDIENPQAFLYKIARNLVIDHYREKARSQTVDTDSVPITDPDEDLQERAFVNSEIEMVKTAIGDIKDDYQEILTWHYIDDYSISEISQMMDKSEGAVRVMLHRALKALRGKVNNIEEA
jgi:RNA polymerase sigma-70 factor (ECF subfamily)